MRPLPDPDDQSSPFWEAAARHELVIQACADCKTLRHPPRPMCAHCNSFDSEWIPSPGTGGVWSWVVAHPPVLPAFEDKVPYNVVVVELDDGVRMIGNLLDAGNDEIEIGMEVVVAFEDIEDGVTLPQWRKA